MSEEILAKRKEKIIDWFKDKYNLLFIILLFFGIAILIKYININTGVWWDELEYLLTAKTYAGLVEYPLAPERAFLFPLLASIVFLLGLDEFWIKIFLELIPSIGILVGTYFLGKELFNKKIGLLAMAIMLVFPEHLFDGARFLSDMLANFLELFTLLTFYIFYVKKRNPSLLWVPVVLGLLGFFTRYTVSLALITIFVYILITKRTAAFRDKNVWIGLFAGIIVFVFYIIYNLFTFGSALPAITHYITNSSTGTDAIVSSYGFVNSSFLYSILSWLSWPLILLFIIGLFSFVKLFLTFDVQIKQDTPSPLLLMGLWFFISAFFWIFVFHYTTSRWSMGLAPLVFILCAQGLVYLYKILFHLLSSDKNREFIKIILILGLLSLFVYGLFIQYQSADSLIKYKADSYSQVKDISLWLRDNTNNTDNILFDSRVWYTYYVERNNSNMFSSLIAENYNYKNMSYVLNNISYGRVPMCEYDIDFTLNRTHPTYLVWNVYEQVYVASPEYLQKNIDLGIFMPIKTFTIDQQISGIVLKIDYEKLESKLSDKEYFNQLVPAVNYIETHESWEAYKKINNMTDLDFCSFN